MNKHKSILKAIFLLIVIGITSYTLCFTPNKAFASENFTIYPTTNYFTQLELDTRDGRIWQVHTAVEKDANIIKYAINPVPLTDMPEPGRFMLSPTGNMYNFILLDTVDGSTWQIQWSFESKKRGIISAIVEYNLN